MNYLLDTAVFVWSLKEPEKLNKKAYEVLEDRSQQAFLSAVSSWEIVIKAAIGKLTLPNQPAQFVANALVRFSLHALSITHAHSLAVGELALYHRDPFDRMLVAQARSENMVLMTADLLMEKYPVEILWCGK
jgi:PIN domain nuclease of toxin-antitoxin system